MKKLFTNLVLFMALIFFVGIAFMTAGFKILGTLIAFVMMFADPFGLVIAFLVVVWLLRLISRID